MSKLFFTAALFAVAVASSPALADRRAYGTTYEAVTAPRGEIDVETWNTYSDGEFSGGPSSRGFRTMLEVEYGITDHWDVALYNMFDMITSGATESGYAGFRLETRYRLADRGEWPIDLVLYAELQQLFRGDADQKFEGKLILGKDIGKVNLALNLAVEEEHLSDGGWKTEGEYALGAAYAVTPAVSVGGEIFGKVEQEMEPSGETELETIAWIGPAISWAGGGAGPLRGVWVTLAGGVGLSSAADPYYGRAIIGLQF